MYLCSYNYHNSDCFPNKINRLVFVMETQRFMCDVQPGSRVTHADFILKENKHLNLYSGIENTG